MRLPLSFAGRMRPLSYALWSFGVFFSQHLIALLALALQARPVAAVAQDWQFYVMPLRALAGYNGTADITLVLALGYLLIAAWMQAALAFRRAADADVSGWIAAFAVAPIVQIPVIVVLCLLPSRATDRGAPIANVGTMDAAAAAQGLVAGLTF